VSESPEKFNLLPFHPVNTEGDRLEYKAYAKAIAEMLSGLKAEHNGLTVGVFGDWGIGKSSVLRMIREELVTRSQKAAELQSTNGKRDRQFLVVNFDAWRYTRQEEVWLALLRRILREVDRRMDWNDVFQVNRALWGNRLATNPRRWRSLVAFMLFAIIVVIFQTVALITLAYLEHIYSIIVVIGAALLTSLIALTDRFLALITTITSKGIAIRLPPLTRSGFDRGQPLLMDDFRNDFRTVIKTVGQKKMIVVLIDDLDRCPQDQVVPVLEAMKHFGVDDWDDPRDKIGKSNDQARIAFVLAADRQAIERAVAGHYKDYRLHMNSAETDRFTREYVEKIVQVTFDLPPLTRQWLEELLPRPEEHVS